MQTRHKNQRPHSMHSNGSALPVIVLALALVAVGLYAAYTRSRNASDVTQATGAATTTAPSALENGSATLTSNSSVANPAATSEGARTNTTSAATAPVKQTPISPRLPNTGGATNLAAGASSIRNGAMPSSTQTNDGITVSLTGGPYTVGATYGIVISPKTLPVRAYSEVKVELVRPGIINSEPSLIASYGSPIAQVPHLIAWTLPKNMDTGIVYAIRVTYTTSDQRNLNSTGLTYVGQSVSFIVQSAARQDSRVILSGNGAVNKSVQVNEKNVSMLSMRIQAQGESATLTHLALGGRVGNDVFNSVENIRAIVDGQTVPLWFANEYQLGTTLWRFESPLIVAADSSVSVTIVADIKPGARSGDVVQMRARGGRASSPVEGTVIGPVVSIE